MARTATTPGVIVRLEVRIGSARPTLYEVGDGGFLIGSVPGCDLRLPGTNLAPVICLIARQASAASLRKLAPVQPVTVNGRPVSSTYLAKGDRIHIGAAEITVSLEGESATVAPPSPAPAASVPAPAQAPVSAPATSPDLVRREQDLREQTEELETNRVIWYKRREEIEAECARQAARLEELTRQIRQQERELGSTRDRLEAREEAFQTNKSEISRQQIDLDERSEELTRQEAEIANLRREMARLREELARKYQQRREKLLTQQQAIRRVARKLLERKRAADMRDAAMKDREQEWQERLAQVEAAREQLAHEKQLVEDQQKLVGNRQQELQREMVRRVEDIQARELALAEDRASLDKGQKQHQADLVRLDRIQASIESRQKQLEQRALEVDKKFEQLQRDTRDLEEQAAQMDEWHNRLTAETERLAIEKKDHETQATEVEQRASALEGQQAMLTTLRTRLERMREELRRQEQAISDQRALQEAGEADLRARQVEAARIREEIDNDKMLFEEERRRFEERRSTLEQAVSQLRLAKESLAVDQQAVKEQQEQIDATAAEQEEQAGKLLTRGEQLQQMAAKLQAESQSFREREAGLTRAEQNLAVLQESVRRRVDELDARQKKVETEEQTFYLRSREQSERINQAEKTHGEAARQLSELQEELTRQAEELEARSREVATRESALTDEQRRLTESQQGLAGQRQALAQERIAWEVERQTAADRDRGTRDEILRARDETVALVRQLPELELRAQAAFERVNRAREQLREHLSEVHTYARQSREDLDTARKEVQAEMERVRQQELDLQVARDEHRLSVAAFRQQLIEWQGRVGEMRQTLQLNSSRLDLRQAEVEQQAREVADTTARLAAEAEQLEAQKKQVARHKGEVDRHLVDMREWYRKKLREVAGIDLPADEVPGESSGDRNPAHAVLTGEEVEPADRQLGELLASLDLVDHDTLAALWSEARRQRRSLRQLLLAGGYLTIYQMALIEAGNLDGLVLGPVRVIDRLRSSHREAAYRVFDPRRNTEAILHLLAEAEMQDAVHPDEFRQRFQAAAEVRHGNIAGVLEVLTVSNRPAALVEYVQGIAASDWPGLVSAPGVWYRLVCQAALALHAAHGASLTHGHLQGSSLVLTGDGVLKLIGLGEPLWLVGADQDSAESATQDLLALGKLAAEWAAGPVGGRGKSKSLPEELQTILGRLTGAAGATPYASAQELIADLEQAGTKVPASAAAWDRLLRQVRGQTGPAETREAAA